MSGGAPARDKAHGLQEKVEGDYQEETKLPKEIGVRATNFIGKMYAESLGLCTKRRTAEGCHGGGRKDSLRESG